MRGRPFRVAWDDEDTVEGLKTGYQGERDVGLRTRLHGLWLLRSGWRMKPVADAVGVDYRTVQRWVGWYREGGLAKVVSHKMGGKGQEPYLSDQAQEEVATKVATEVATEVATGRFRTAVEIREWIVERYGVTYKMAGIYSLMGRLHCSTKVPRPMHEKADAEQQASWKKGACAKPLPKLG